MFENELITYNNFMKHAISFKMLRRTNSKLPFLLFIDAFVGVDSRGADCTKSSTVFYGRFLFRAPSALNIYAIAFVLFTRTPMMELGRASSVVGGHFRKQKGFRYL